MRWPNATAAKDDAIWPDTFLQSQYSLRDIVDVIRNVLCPNQISTLPLYNKITIDCADRRERWCETSVTCLFCDLRRTTAINVYVTSAQFYEPLGANLLVEQLSQPRCICVCDRARQDFVTDDQCCSF